MATIYTYETAETITDGLQGAMACDEAINTARSIASDRQEPVVLEDDGDIRVVMPGGTIREMTEQERHDGGWDRQEEEA